MKKALLLILVVLIIAGAWFYLSNRGSEPSSEIEMLNLMPSQADGIIIFNRIGPLAEKVLESNFYQVASEKLEHSMDLNDQFAKAIGELKDFPGDLKDMPAEGDAKQAILFMANLFMNKSAIAVDIKPAYEANEISMLSFTGFKSVLGKMFLKVISQKSTQLVKSSYEDVDIFSANSPMKGYPSANLFIHKGFLGFSSERQSAERMIDNLNLKVEHSLSRRLSGCKERLGIKHFPNITLFIDLSKVQVEDVTSWQGRMASEYIELYVSLTADSACHIASEARLKNPPNERFILNTVEMTEYPSFFSEQSTMGFKLPISAAKEFFNRYAAPQIRQAEVVDVIKSLMERIKKVSTQELFIMAGNLKLVPFSTSIIFKFKQPDQDELAVMEDMITSMLRDLYAGGAGQVKFEPIISEYNRIKVGSVPLPFVSLGYAAIDGYGVISLNENELHAVIDAYQDGTDKAMAKPGMQYVDFNKGVYACLINYRELISQVQDEMMLPTTAWGKELKDRYGYIDPELMDLYKVISRVNATAIPRGDRLEAYFDIYFEDLPTESGIYGQ